MLSKLRLASEQDTATIKAAKEELEEGMKALLNRHKLIRIADRSELGWQVVDSYELDKVALGDKDAKHLEKAEKVTKQKPDRKWKWMALRSARSRPVGHGAQSSQTTGPQGPTKSFVPGPVITTAQQHHRRIPGPCFNCLEMGHQEHLP